MTIIVTKCPICGKGNDDNWPICVDGEIKTGGCQMCWEEQCSELWHDMFENTNWLNLIKDRDHYKAEAERYELAWRSVASDYNMILAEEQRLRKKVESITALAEKYKAERDELIGLIQGRHIMQYLDDVWEVLDTAISRIKGE